MRGIWLLLGLLRYPYNRNNSMVLTLRQMWSPGRYMGSLFSKTKRESGSINRDCMQSSFWVLEFVVSYVPGNKNRAIVNHVSSPENIVIIGFGSEGKMLIYFFLQRHFNRKIYTWMFSGSDLWCFYCSALSDIEILLQRKRLSDSYDGIFCEVSWGIHSYLDLIYLAMPKNAGTDIIF